MKTQMTEEEVRRDYRLAKYPEEQIGILADINDVTITTIKRVLNGADWETASFGEKRRDIQLHLPTDHQQREPKKKSRSRCGNIVSGTRRDISPLLYTNSIPHLLIFCK